MTLTSSLDGVAALAPPPEQARHEGTLLIVDDEDVVRQTLQVVFKNDYELLIACDGATAIQLAQQHKIDVAILDIKMKGMSGIEVLGRLKHLDPRIQVVMLTAFETTDLLRQALRGGACDYLVKPFDLATMRAAVVKAMQRRTLESDIHTHAEKIQALLNELHDQKIGEQMATSRGEIYASIIHDINGPLTVVSGFVQLMNQRIGSATRLELEDLEFVKGRLKTITRQVTNCMEISRRYLNFLRQQADDAPRVGINQLLADLEQLVRVHPSLQGNRFAVRPLAEDMAACMNGTDVIQVLLNLTVNALQCTPQTHSVEIEGCVLHTLLDLAAHKDGPNDRLLNVENAENQPPILMLSVRDTGPGIPPETLSKIFQTFFSTKGARQGTGLGLSIVQRLLKQAKGALQVHTQVGEGTCFTVYLPAVPAATG
ncbi:MAG TPA: hybrid sensor histidine kinase/response regulator [Candidatus Paceibacterota bacterium]|nr:hybrid sensor histidine kinase/response regulator [Verrucomicrobiota bacterium]HSA10406.1 hybrid sensor histidine kinase/response regulator [Candidatus Paceibacterota bacterium]